MSDFHVWRKDVIWERKRIKKEERGYQLREAVKTKEEEAEKRRKEETKEDKMSSAVSWAIKRIRNHGELG